MNLKYTIQLFDLAKNQDEPCIGYRIISSDENLACITDADYLMHSLSETLSHIATPVPEGAE